MVPDNKQAEVIQPPRGFYWLVARQATIPSLFSARKMEPANLAKSLVRQWRARVHLLAAQDWERVAPRPLRRDGSQPANPLQQALNCPSALFPLPPKTFPCQMPLTCPHCWGRRAGEQWHVIDAKLFGSATQRSPRPKARPDLALVFRRLAVSVPFVDFEGRPPLRAVLTRRLLRPRGPDRSLYTVFLAPREYDLRRLKQAGAVGGLEVIRPLLTPSEANPEEYVGWTVDIRQLVLVPTEKLASYEQDQRTRHGALVRSPRSIVAPTRAQVALAVAWAYRYPRFLLRGPAALTLATLEAQQGMRLTTRFGCCYGG